MVKIGEKRRENESINSISMQLTVPRKVSFYTEIISDLFKTQFRSILTKFYKIKIDIPTWIRHLKLSNLRGSEGLTF